MDNNPSNLPAPTITRTVWRFALMDAVLTGQPVSLVEMPAGAEVIRFGFQMGVPSVWAIVDPGADLVLRRFVLVESGEQLPQGAAYIGTVAAAGDAGGAVTHLFETVLG
jgi:hypothetical protein